MSSTVIIVPRWAGNADSDFYPWLSNALSSLGHDVRCAPLKPAPERPTVEATVASLQATAGDTPVEDLVLVAQSVGCQAALRWLAALPAEVSLKGFAAVAGWWTLDEVWPDIRPFVEDPFDVPRARSAAGKTQVFLSDNDPYTSDHEANAAAWKAKMGASVTTLPGRAHFNEDRFPELLAWLKLEAL